MINFFKHHWSKREKFFARWSLSHLIIALIAGTIIAGAVVAMQVGQDRSRVMDLRQTAQQEQDQSQLPPGTQKIGGSFDLINQDGQATTDASFRGKYMLIYFGYTYCPDMCPTGLQSMAHALDLLGADADKVAPIFITIDPARDTAAKLKTYVREFSPKITGLTGSDQQIAAAAAAYQVFYSKGEQVDDHDYVMDHSSLIYLMKPDGSFLTTFPEEVEPAAIVATIKAQKS